MVKLCSEHKILTDFGRCSINGCRVRRMRESNLIRHTVQPFTESDDTRCCDNKICPPEDGHVDVRNMSRIVM